LWPNPDRTALEAALRAAGAQEIIDIMPVPGVTIES
jgi:hypothetical protein